MSCIFPARARETIGIDHPTASLSLIPILRLSLLMTTTMPPSQILHPPRLASIFATSPSAPGTPVHSIQTVRRKAAGHSGPLTKILVANRGVSPYNFLGIIELDAIYPPGNRDSRFSYGP